MAEHRKPPDNETALLGLQGRTALITGGNQGIGWATAEALASQGARVAVNYPDDARTPADMIALGPEAIAVKGDIARLDEIDAMIATTVAAFGRIDILVNNAGIFPRGHVLDLDEATWDVVIDVNLKGTFFCAQRVARLMVEQRSGRIINIASDSALLPSPVGAHYCASKAGVIALTKSLAVALAPHGIAVNCVAPGLTDTAQPRYGMSEAEIAARGEATPYGRLARPDDIARAVLFLASDLSDYVVGQTLFANGGSLMVP